MQSVTDILKNSAVTNRSSEPPKNTSTDRKAVMVEFWKELMRLKLVHQMPGSAEFQTWARSCNDLSDAEVGHGVLRARNFTGFWTVPAFRELCKPDPESLGMPSPEAAYREAASATSPVTAFRWSHPAVYHAGSDTGWFDLRNLPEGVVKKRFIDNYDRRVRQVLSGEELNMPRHLAIERQEPGRSSKEYAHEQCENLRKLFQ